MKKRIFNQLLSFVLCTALLFSCLPFTAFAESTDTDVQMVEGDVIADFAAAGCACTSSDPAVAWVDENGDLNAMKTGTATVSDGTTDYTVTVGEYEDGSEVVGNLKILARYNDSMQFYDGHVYLLFTSYQDGVTVTVPDLYAAYEISDQYYEDIGKDISKGSNHTGQEVYDYFSESYDVRSMTLDRGEIVTIGMYRGFDLSVLQAVLGSIQNSTSWKELVAAGKASAVLSIFDILYKGKISSDEALARLKTALEDTGIDYNKLLDGVVDGGVCFNRELYNQKLEWDQYENVTYELDITRNQLDTMMTYLGGNNGKFSILKNSCATVALRAWNAAVGTRNGAATSYYLTSQADGIYSIIDAPKGVRDNIVKRLPGYYLNNAAGVAEPDAGYQDDTGWVYVSAPEKVSPLSPVYDDDTIVIDSSATKLSSLINAAKGDTNISYNKASQEIGVSVRHETQGDLTTIGGVDFTVNGTTVSLDEDSTLEDAVTFMTPYAAPAENEYYCLLDQDGEEISGYYSEGYLFISTESFPITYQVTSRQYEDEASGINVSECGAYDTDIKTEVYWKNGDEKTVIEDSAELDPGTKVYIRPVIPEDDDKHILHEITFNEENVMNGEHYDAEEKAYFVIVPDEFAGLGIFYEEATLSLKGEGVIQMQVGEVLNIKDHVKLTVNNTEEECDNVAWQVVLDPFDGSVACDETTLTGVKSGGGLVKAYAATNPNISKTLVVEVYDSFDNMAAITTDDNAGDYEVWCESPAQSGYSDAFLVKSSGYRVPKGSVLTVKPTPKDSKALRSVKFNGKAVKAGESYTVNEDTQIKAEFADAQIKGLPKTVKLASKEDTYQLNAEVKYTGLLQFLPVYDSSITYQTSDPLIEVDEKGSISVAGDIPEGGCVAYVTAYAGSSNDKVSAVCKVVIGDYQGDRIVGSLTVSARPIVQAQLISHAMVTFTAYEDVDLDVSYYEYYKPNEKFYALMQDYTDHPENYNSDPVLYSNNELGIEDRESYFDISSAGAFSDPQPIQLHAGESITMSNYGIESSGLYFVLKALDNSSLYAVSPQVQELVGYIKQYMAGEEIDAPAAFDDMISTFVQIYGYTGMTGVNPADGVGDGGLMINREAYNQFRRSDSQTPNHYYTVDITADELALLKAYLADPQNNYYSLMTMSCATGTVNIWNYVLSDRPEHQIKGNLTGLGNDPMSIYYEIGSLKYKSGLDGKGGDDFYPRLVTLSKSDDPDPKPVEPGEQYLLGDADGDGTVTIIDATTIQRYLAGIIGKEYIDQDAADIGRDGLDITDATYIQRYLAGIDVEKYPITKVFDRASGAPAETPAP